MASSFKQRSSLGSAGSGSKLNPNNNSNNSSPNPIPNQVSNLQTGSRFNNRQGNNLNSSSSSTTAASPRWGLNSNQPSSNNPHQQSQSQPNPNAFPSLHSAATGGVDTQALMRDRMLFLLVSLVVSISTLYPSLSFSIYLFLIFY